MLQTGDCVGRYEIQIAVGKGGFGRVYRAWDPQFERLVAIKELSGERKAREPAKYAEYMERFRLERRVQGRFQHPHIVSVYDLVQQDGDEYLVEEYVDGGTLQGLIREQGTLPPERVVRIGIEMCQAISVAWEQDVVHRDVKPSNILLTGDGQAKLTDFGVAQSGQMSQRTQSDSHHPGTPAYMSPEQEKASGYLDERSDLYALGLVLYETLTGKSFKRERVPVRQLAPGAPKELAQVVMRALAQEPADRYQRAAEFETALRHALDKSRPVWLWWVGGTVVLLALIVGGGFLSGTWSQSTPAPTATLTATPSRTQTSPPPTSTATGTPTPTATPTFTRTPRPSATPSPTATLSPMPVSDLAASAPRLIDPPGATAVTAVRVTFRWEGELPSSSYGFRVSLYHESGEISHVSPLLDGTQWTTNLPGEARDAVGGWRWSVVLVRRGDAENVVASSGEWTFYFDPFGGPIPAHSPLSSPLSTPGP